MVTKPINILSGESCNKENVCNNRDDIEGNAEIDLLYEDEVNSPSHCLLNLMLHQNKF